MQVAEDPHGIPTCLRSFLFSIVSLPTSRSRSSALSSAESSLVWCAHFSHQQNGCRKGGGQTGAGAVPGRADTAEAALPRRGITSLPGSLPRVMPLLPRGLPAAASVTLLRRLRAEPGCCGSPERRDTESPDLRPTELSRGRALIRRMLGCRSAAAADSSSRVSARGCPGSGTGACFCGVPRSLSYRGISKAAMSWAAKRRVF